MRAQVTTDIAGLLAPRRVRLVGPTGDQSAALSRAELTATLGASYETFHALRSAIDVNAPLPRGAASRAIGCALEKAGIIRVVDRRLDIWGAVDREAQLYLAGGWLEEFGFLAFKAAGADEVYYRQQLEWEYGDVVGRNEIDVLAREGDRLFFMSCKAGQPFLAPSSVSRQRLKDFLFEPFYWDRHFADGGGTAVLMVSTDLIDEYQGGRKRYAQFFVRAEILEVDVVSRDLFHWDTLLSRVRSLLKQSRP